jgi:hypothetical protein
MKNKKLIILSVVAIALLGGGWYAYSEYTRKVKDLAKVKADMKLTVAELLSAFENNETQANLAYLDKVISVKGTVRTVEKNEKGFYSVVLGEEGSMSSVRCSINPNYKDDIIAIPAGSLVTMKGACTGFNQDELLGSDVILNRCVLDK